MAGGKPGIAAVAKDADDDDVGNGKTIVVGIPSVPPSALPPSPSSPPLLSPATTGPSSPGGSRGCCFCVVMVRCDSSRRRNLSRDNAAADPDPDPEEDGGAEGGAEDSSSFVIVVSSVMVFNLRD